MCVVCAVAIRVCTVKEDESYKLTKRRRKSSWKCCVNQEKLLCTLETHPGKAIGSNVLTNHNHAACCAHVHESFVDESKLTAKDLVTSELNTVVDKDSVVLSLDGEDHSFELSGYTGI